ncbi:MAG: aminotransferase class V-fold PLP-dependent enzyme [Bacilli bacterium]
MLDFEKIRKDIPAISQESIYLDSVASSLTPMSVIDAMNEYYCNFRANVHRGTYRASIEASERFEEALQTVSSLIGASMEEIVFVSNTTHGINEVAFTLDFQVGDEVIISSLEHSSNTLPWMRLAKMSGLVVKEFIAEPDGTLDISRLQLLLSSRTRLVSITFVSNVTGAVTPVEEIGRICKERNIMYLVDAAQAVPHRKIDVKKIGCDFLVFSGHKMLGPTGIGVLYIRKSLGESLIPAFLGGGTIDEQYHVESLNSSTIDSVKFSNLPYKWISGTPPIAEAIGLKAAVDYLTTLGFDDIASHDRVSAAAQWPTADGIACPEVDG